MDVLLSELSWLIEVAVLIAVLGLYKHLGIQPGHPIALGTVCLYFMICLLWSWKNKAQFAKRCILAAPFGLLLTIVFRFVGFEMGFSIYAGMATFLFLIIRTDNWKLHLFITLITALAFTFLLASIRRGDLNIYKACIISVIVLPFAVFFVAYVGALDSKKTIELYSLLVKSIKFSGVLLLSSALFLISHNLCRHYHLGSVIPFMISGSIAMGFLGVCYWFKLGLSDSSVGNKNEGIRSKESIDRLKMSFYLFGGKDEKTDKTGKCEFCGRAICGSEVSHVIKGHTVCGQCFEKIADEKTRIT